MKQVILNHFALLEQINGCKEQNKKIKLCEQDVEIAEEFAIAYNQEIKENNKRRAAYGEPPIDMKLPRYPSFQILAIYYEKLGMIDEAIKICERALKYGFVADTMKGGTEARLNKLKKRLIRDE